MQTPSTVSTLPGLARHTLILAALTPPMHQPLDNLLSYFFKSSYSLSSCLTSALIHFAHSGKHPFFRETPLRCLRIKAPPTGPLCDGRSGHAVSVSKTRPALSTGSVSLRAQRRTGPCGGLRKP